MDLTDTELEETAEGAEESYELPETDTEETSEVYEQYEEEPPVKAGKYRFLSILLFVLTAGGLFLGLIGNKAAWLKPSYYFGDSGLNNSLLGFFFTRMKELFTHISVIFTGSAGEITRHVFGLLAALVLLATVIMSLVCLIMTFASPRRAKKACILGGTVSLLSYTLLFVWAYCVNSFYLPSFQAAAIDVPVALITACLFIVMTAIATAENRKKGLLGAWVWLFAVATAFAFFFPGSFTEKGIALLLAFGQHPSYNILSLVTVCIILAEVCLSTVALSRSNGRGIIRSLLFGAGFVVVIALTITGCGLGGEWNFAFFKNGSLLPSLVLLFASLGAALLSVIIAVADRRDRQAYDYSYLTDEDETETTDAEEETESEDDVYTDDSEDETDDDAEIDEFEERMASFIRKSKEKEEPAEEDIPVPPYARPAAKEQPYIRPVGVYTDPSTQYTYDPFINELTPEEKNEFGDLFIAYKSGKYGDLPVYHIGGDNSEFFDKVWIRYGMYDMSPNLREKLFTYLRKYRNKQ